MQDSTRAVGHRWTRWTRSPDWVALVAGVYALLSPIWTQTTTRATWTVVVLGVVTGLVALGSLARPGHIMTEGGEVVLGVLFFIAPWVMSYAAITGIAWTSWIVGVIVALTGLAALPVSNRLHHQVAGSH